MPGKCHPGGMGTPEQCVERLVGLHELGLERVAIEAFGRPGAEAQANPRASRAALVEEVIPAVRARLG